ncbi:MAG: cytochrome c biogenesis protein ResB, partial [Lentisphaeria bacterium]|nr:cytochrome c biogenesis protein ResB [Lentisphaeria bacterium]
MATILLILITLSAIIGGVIPQTPITPNADEIYHSYGVFWYRIITRLSLNDVFHSSWFLAMTALFALNLSLCTARRARRSIARIFLRARYVAIPEGDKTTHRIAIGGAGANLAPLVRKHLRRRGFLRIDQVSAPADRPAQTQLVGQRWRLGFLGPDLVHAGILVILAGALLGVFRQEGTLVVNELEKGARIPACGAAASSDCVPLIYDLRIDDFGVETYEGSARVKTYWADLTFLEGNDPILQDRISVNRPLSIGGFGFHPWRYGDDVEAAVVRLQVMESERNAVTSELELQIGDTVVVPRTQLWLTALRFYRTFALTDDGQ